MLVHQIKEKDISFGNELIYTDRSGLTANIEYDENTGEVIKSIDAVGTDYEFSDNTMPPKIGEFNMDYINKLLNQKVLDIGRASNLLWITFGDAIRKKDAFGKEVEKGEYSLHFQCPWRILDEESSMIYLASGDIYEPNTGTEWSEDFDWEPKGNNLFDEKIKEIFPIGEEMRVKEIIILPNNDLKIAFSHGFIFESFIDISAKQECWRFFKQEGEKHFVVGGNFKEFQ